MADNDKSPHILNTSANLLGLCFIVLTSLKALNLNEATFIDELTALAIILFMGSSVLSFLSMRSSRMRNSRYEKTADVLFLSGLLFLFVTAMLLVFNVVT